MAGDINKTEIQDIIRNLLTNNVHILEAPLNKWSGGQGFDNTPLHTIISNEYPDKAMFILKTALEIANTQKIKLNLDITDNMGKTLLMMAILVGQSNIAELLIKNGADVNSHDINGNTSLHMSSILGNIKIVKLLLERDADLIKSKNVQKQTPQQYVENSEKETVVNVLASIGINPGRDENARDNNDKPSTPSGRSLLDVCWDKRKDVLTILRLKERVYDELASKRIYSKEYIQM